MIVYLAGPIDDVGTDEATGWRRSAATFLARRKIGVYDPAAAFSPVASGFGVTIDDAPDVRFINDAAIQASDLLLANCHGGFTLGTVREIQRAVSWKVPVVMVEPVLGTKSFEKHDLDCHLFLGPALDAIARRLG